MGAIVALAVGFLLALQTVPALGAPLEYDEDTLLLLHFDGDAADAAGIEPAVATSPEYEPGVFGQGCRLRPSPSLEGADSLYYATPPGFDPREGSVEFWISSRWSGAEYYVQQAFNAGDVRVQVNIPGILAFFMLEPENEVGYLDVQGWEDGDWHHVAATWKIPGRQRLYVDGVLRMDNPATDVDLLPEAPEYIRLGAAFPTETVDAVLDEFRLSSRQRTHHEIAAAVMAAPLTVDEVALSRNAIRLEPGWHFTPVLEAVTDLGPDHLPNPVAAWASSDPSVAAVDSVGLVTAGAPGTAHVLATYGDFAMGASVTVDEILLPPRAAEADSFLAQPAEGHLWEIPVVILAFLPTLDGTRVEEPGQGSTMLLEEARQRVHMFSRRVKFAAEEGSRFRGYRDAAAVPSLGYRVVDFIYVHEHMPLSDNQVWWYPSNQYPEYHQVLERFDGRRYVEEEGVKEFWMWYSGYNFNGIGFELPESNMSSPVTGDISNSARLANDLPVYDRSYVVYQFDWTGNHAYAIHNFGHQLESMLSYANEKQDGDDELFIHRFCGMDSTETWITGRCGWTHMPPNTNRDYVYDETAPALSDCEDWTPDGVGQQQWVDVSTWRDIEYEWPPEPVGWTPDDSPYHLNWQRAEAHFYIYWRQNWPGHNNGITYGADRALTNWWEIIADWDGAMDRGLGLYTYDTPTAVVAAGDGPREPALTVESHPNPFNSSARLTLQIPEPGAVQVVLYDALGQRVRHLVSTQLSAGTHRLTWDGRDQARRPMASGLYYVRVDWYVAGQVQSRALPIALVR